jgi:hypothetical protein
MQCHGAQSQSYTKSAVGPLKLSRQTAWLLSHFDLPKPASSLCASQVH